MISRLSTRTNEQLREFDRAIITATYFGFRPIVAPKITKRDIELVQHCGNDPHYDALEKMAVLRTYLEQNFASQQHPLTLVYKSPATKVRASSYALHFIGSVSGIAEATLIRTALSILKDAGHKNLQVDLNCIGDKESISLYERELGNFVRKFGVDLSNELKQKIKEDIFNLFRSEAPEIMLLREIAPSALTFLSAPSRIYFKEVLEYIEALGIEFRLAPELVGERNHVSHAIFTIKNADEKIETLAIGYRYSRLARLLGLRKEIPMAGVTIFPEAKVGERGRMYKELPRPKFFLVQLGREARVKTLSLIELLRSHRIPVYHFLGKDKITTQLSNAENLRVSHLIIIGQKEALDNTATVRNVATRAQDTICITDLPHYLKHITL